MSTSRRLRPLAASLLLVLALAGVAAESWGHHHDLSADALHGAGGGEVLLCASGSRALHVEAARAVEVSLCEVCLLRAHDRGARTALAVSPVPLPEPAAWVVATDPRIASLGTAGPPGSRGPPSPTVVS
jgi:microcompartment protein CcmK/EutM